MCTQCQSFACSLQGVFEVSPLEIWWCLWQWNVIFFFVHCSLSSRSRIPVTELAVAWQQRSSESIHAWLCLVMLLMLLMLCLH